MHEPVNVVFMICTLPNAREALVHYCKHSVKSVNFLWNRSCYSEFITITDKSVLQSKNAVGYMQISNF